MQKLASRISKSQAGQEVSGSSPARGDKMSSRGDGLGSYSHDFHKLHHENRSFIRTHLSNEHRQTFSFPFSKSHFDSFVLLRLAKFSKNDCNFGLLQKFRATRCLQSHISMNYCIVGNVNQISVWLFCECLLQSQYDHNTCFFNVSEKLKT